MKLLFASPEVFPLAKTGGLADVSAALPAALAELGVDLRVLTLAYRGSLDKLATKRKLSEFDVRGQNFTLWEGHLPDNPATLWLLDCEKLYARVGDPYHDASGEPFGDNPWRFGCFCDAIARLASGKVSGIRWQPDVVQLNDWQTALAAPWIAREWPKPAVVFTIHNIAYQGQYGQDQFNNLGLPPEWWAPEALEFHNGFSFMKGGIVFSDAVTTVSPNYAREIQTADFGHGMDGLLRQRREVLHGILNGIDDRTWNPARDTHLVRTYSAATVTQGKRANKLALQKEMGLTQDEQAPVLAVVSRLAHQKGSDVILEAGQELMQLGVQLAVLGAGERGLEYGYSELARLHPGRVAVRIGYDEGLAHRIEAGADMFLMPSRFEPCGLNQMYSQRYGTVPLVRRTGGLADTVVDATLEALEAGEASGVMFDHADTGGVRYAVTRALALYGDVRLWEDLQRAGMTRDFSWRHAAREYLNLFSALATHRR